MTDKVPSLIEPPSGYAEWFSDLKGRIHGAQQRAALAVNTELVRLYWQIGRDILDRQEAQGWGAKVIDRLSHDLRAAFPALKGFSPRNLRYMRDFAKAWPDDSIWQQDAAKLPWTHIMILLDKLSTAEARRAYAAATVEHGWSRNVLAMHIKAGTLERTGQAITNFAATLPAPQSDLARQALRDPYKLDFLGLGNDAQEREIENAIVDHVTRFLVELGAGFAYAGRQVPLRVGGDEFFIDLLLYHLKLRCYVVIEIKAGKFTPEHLGQLGFYLTAVDAEVKHEQDAPTIGLLLCRTKNEVVAEYALRDKKSSLGIAEYELLQGLPEPLQTNLPSIEQLERELGDQR